MYDLLCFPSEHVKMKTDYEDQCHKIIEEQVQRIGEKYEIIMKGMLHSKHSFTCTNDRNLYWYQGSVINITILILPL